MKNLKKLLAVVLVMAMAFTFMATAAAANVSDYTDADDVTYVEAINVLTNAGVLDGMGDGTFDPTGNFTREQAAKVICYLLLGPKTAELLSASSSTFSDVEATRWSAPFIEYCVIKDVIHGMGDGTFDPAGNVTGVQFAKMLLTAIGYGKNDEYVGNNWDINVISDAGALGVLTLDVDYTAPATREQVAQYALNALTKPFQVYSKDSESYEDKTTGITDFATRLGLVLDSNAESNGVTGRRWSFAASGLLIGFYPTENVIAASTNGLPISLLTDSSKATFVCKAATGFEMVVNGFKAVSTGTDTAVAAGAYLYDANGVIYTANAAGAANAVSKTEVPLAAGDIVSFIDLTPFNGVSYADKISVTMKTVDVIGFNAVKTVPGINNNPDSVTVDLSIGTDIIGTVKTVVGYEGLAYRDVISYYVDSLGVTHIEKATPVTGKLQGYNSLGTTVTLGGEVYTLSGAANAKNQAFIIGLGFVNDITLYTDSNGYVVYATGQAVAPTADKAVLLACGDVLQSGITPAYTEAQILLPDGTTKLVTSTQDKAALDSLGSQIVSYKVDAATGAYTFTAVGNDGGSAATITKGLANFAGTGVYGNSATVFLIRNGSAPAYTYTVCTGIANVPTMTGVTYEYALDNGICSLVYISAATSSVASTNTVFFYSLDNTYTAPSAVGAGDDYYTYKAVVGTSGSQDVKVARSVTIPASGVYAVTFDSLGRVNSVTEVVDGAYFEVGYSTSMAASGVVGIDGKYFSYVEDAPVYHYNTLTKVLSTSTVLSIETADSGTYAVAAIDAYGQVTAVYIISA